MKLSVRHALATVLFAFAASIGCIAETSEEHTEDTGVDESVGVAQQLASCTPSNICDPWTAFDNPDACCTNKRKQRTHYRWCLEVTYGCDIREWFEIKNLCDGSSC
jgi:hypothetical protein